MQTDILIPGIAVISTSTSSSARSIYDGYAPSTINAKVVEMVNNFTHGEITDVRSVSQSVVHMDNGHGRVVITVTVAYTPS